MSILSRDGGRVALSVQASSLLDVRSAWCLRSDHHRCWWRYWCLVLWWQD